MRTSRFASTCRTYVVFGALSGLCATASAQQYNLAGSPASTLGDWTIAPSAGFVAGSNFRALADVNADGRDDIVWVQQTPSLTAARVFTSVGNGLFNTHYRSDDGTNSNNGSMPTTNSGSIDFLFPLSIAAGNYVGGAAAEVLLCARSPVPTYWLLDWSAAGKPAVLATRTNTIGAAQIETSVNGQTHSTKVISGNFAGLNGKEILTLEREATGVRAHVQWFVSPGLNDFRSLWTNNGNSWLGGWAINWDQDEFHVADFIASNNTGANVKEEILCVNKTNGWMKIIAYNEVTRQWNDVYQNGGTYGFLPYPPAVGFGAATRFLVGNFDADANTEIVIYNWGANGTLPWRSYEFDRVAGALIALRTVTPTLTGLVGNYTSPDQSLTAWERWTSPRVCLRRVLGICVNWSGGQVIMTQRVFNSIRTQAGETDFLVGRFGATGQPVTRSQLVAFYYYSSTLPSIPHNSVFLTSCNANHITSGACGSAITIYNILGQMINTYYPATNTFSNNTPQPSPPKKQMLVPTGTF